jgi:cation diffusion facilitator CzcD-associated flavoprotein CzcO
MEANVAVLGAGSSGLAGMKAFREQGLDVDGFERGSDLGGLWRYENDNGLSAAYASLRTNVSRPRSSTRASRCRAAACGSGRLTAVTRSRSFH